MFYFWKGAGMACLPYGGQLVNLLDCPYLFLPNGWAAWGGPAAWAFTPFSSCLACLP